MKQNQLFMILKKKFIKSVLRKKKEIKKDKIENENNEENLLLIFLIFYKQLKKENPEKEEEEKENEDINYKFTLKQKIVLIIFSIGFGIMIYGVMALDWWFEHMSSTFLVLSIILMLFLAKGESKGVETFVSGAGDFVGVAMIVGLARGINITLEYRNIQDIILNSLSNAISGLPKIIFAVLMLIIFMILGIFITGLAILSMPIFCPLGDEINCERKIIVNTYKFWKIFLPNSISYWIDFNCITNYWNSL